MQKLNQFLQCKVTNNLKRNSVGYGLLFINYEQRGEWLTPFLASLFLGLNGWRRFCAALFLSFLASSNVTLNLFQCLRLPVSVG